MNNETNPASVEVTAEGETGRSPSALSQIPRIDIRDAGHHAGETVRIHGWLYNLRKSGKLVFPIVRDGSGMIQ